MKDNLFNKGYFKRIKYVEFNGETVAINVDERLDHFAMDSDLKIDNIDLYVKDVPVLLGMLKIIDNLLDYAWSIGNVLEVKFFYQGNSDKRNAVEQWIDDLLKNDTGSGFQMSYKIHVRSRNPEGILTQNDFTYYITISSPIYWMDASDKGSYQELRIINRVSKQSLPWLFDNAVLTPTLFDIKALQDIPLNTMLMKYSKVYDKDVKSI